MNRIGSFISGTLGLALLCGLGYGVYQHIEGQTDPVAAFRITVADVRALGGSLHAGRGVNEVVDVVAVVYGACAGAGALLGDGAIDLFWTGLHSVPRSDMRQSRYETPLREAVRPARALSYAYARAPSPV